jgi:hypothetical protein
MSTFQSTLPGAAQSPVITFGGSYGGTCSVFVYVYHFTKYECRECSVGSAVSIIWDPLWILQSFSCDLLNPVKILKGPAGQMRFAREWYYRKVRG